MSLHIVNFYCVLIIIQLVSADYWTIRQKFIDDELNQFLGASINLTNKEEDVNKIIMKYKLAELEKGFNNPKKFPPAVNFLQSKTWIDKSELFSIIKLIPKGAGLHSHDMSLGSYENFYQITFNDNIYVCILEQKLRFHVFDNMTTNECNWILLSKLRSGPESQTIDKFIKDQVTVITDNPFQRYADINEVWAKASECFGVIQSLLSYKPFYEEYFYRALKGYYDDNVTYLEFRSVLPELYTTDGKTYGPEDVVASYISTLKKFKNEHPDFHGARLIYAPVRRVNQSKMEDYVSIAKRLKQKFPEFIAGFDLVGQEDLGRPLSEFVAQLEGLSSELKLFFHAGETNWNGMSTDMNIIDAILLNVTRIGHAYAIDKHPKALEMVKTKLIPMEVSPISNQVLKLVDDLRNHPAAILISQNYPLVIANDDPALWGAEGLSYDWFMAFLGFTNSAADLRFLKKLALNSIEFSVMESDEKKNVLQKWENDWDAFLDEVLHRFNLNYYNVHRV